MKIVAADQTRAIAEQMSAPTAAASAGGMPPDQKKAFKVSNALSDHRVLSAPSDYILLIYLIVYLQLNDRFIIKGI